MPLVEVVVEGYARAPSQVVFATIAPIDLTQIFTGLGPLPAVVGRRAQTGAWDHVGATRVIQLSDGSEAGEQLTAYEPPHHFAYRVGPFTGRLRFAASHANGAWWFSDLSERGTHIRWSYAFALDGPAAPLARFALPVAWRAYARQILARAIAEADASA